MRKQYHFWPGTDGLDAWGVDRLVELARDLPVAEIPIAAVAEVDSVYWFDKRDRPTVRKVIEHMRLVNEVDLSYPVILGPDGRVMDGMHRIARVLLDGGTTIPAVMLPVLPPPDYRGCRPENLPY